MELPNYKFLYVMILLYEFKCPDKMTWNIIHYITHLFNGGLLGYIEFLPHPGSSIGHEIVALGGGGLSKVPHTAFPAGSTQCTTTTANLSYFTTLCSSIGVDMPHRAGGGVRTDKEYTW